MDKKPAQITEEEKNFLSAAYLQHCANEKYLRLKCFEALTRYNFPASPDMKIYTDNAQLLYNWVVKADTA